MAGRAGVQQISLVVAIILAEIPPIVLLIAIVFVYGFNRRLPGDSALRMVDGWPRAVRSSGGVELAATLWLRQSMRFLGGSMMTAKEVVEELRTMGAESIKKVLSNHGVREPFFGVKIGDMKKIQKRIKKDYQLVLDLYDTGNYDAMYLAGLVADDAKMTKKDLNRWVESAIGAPGGGDCPMGRGGK